MFNFNSSGNSTCSSISTLFSSSTNPFNYNYNLVTANEKNSHKKSIQVSNDIDLQTYLWRLEAHRVLDPLYRGEKPIMTRSEAYAYVQHLMGLSEEKAHIGSFSINQCKELIDLLDFQE